MVNVCKDVVGISEASIPLFNHGCSTMVLKRCRNGLTASVSDFYSVVGLAKNDC